MIIKFLSDSFVFLVLITLLVSVFFRGFCGFDFGVLVFVVFILFG